MTTKKPESQIERLRARYERLRRQLDPKGLVLLGTITERTIERPDPGDPSRSRTFGPYFQWTFKEAGKTVTVNLSAGQVRAFQAAIDRNRKLEETAEEMRRIARQILDASTPGVKRRKKANEPLT